jgi:hypothetical protein
MFEAGLAPIIYTYLSVRRPYFNQISQQPTPFRSIQRDKFYHIRNRSLVKGTCRRLTREILGSFIGAFPDHPSSEETWSLAEPIGRSDFGRGDFHEETLVVLRFRKLPISDSSAVILGFMMRQIGIQIKAQEKYRCGCECHGPRWKRAVAS